MAKMKTIKIRPCFSPGRRRGAAPYARRDEQRIVAIRSVDLIIAHNTGFNRPLYEALSSPGYRLNQAHRP
ncbi:hypothetical protein GR212_26515 [Rhizobium lusitanum]|uniref:Uncharacterized protein n=1 Tax=Rhizobium lusitanum TaxID=293958 RepID=A0A6L9UFN6_9HYPH|nr:hypothetical protein [Rhizobium lusitanum]NEI73122.1 hypothetical protein [Rhizobium lusitanum]